MDLANLKKNQSYIDIFCFFILFIFSLSTFYFSYINQIDISGGGSSTDIRTHYKYIKVLNTNLNNLFTFGSEFKLMNFPLHHIIFSRFDFLSDDLDKYLNVFVLISFFLPLLFYLNLKTLFPYIDNLKILFYTMLIISLPNFQASAIWGNNHITSLIFLLISVLFLNLHKTENPRTKTNIFFIFFFLSLAAYTRQYYVILFPFFILRVLESNKNNYLFILSSLFLLALPGIFYLNYNPKLLIFNAGLEITNFYSSIIITGSIIGFFLFPFYLMNFKENVHKFFEFLKKRKNKIIFILFLLFFIFIAINFKYDGTVGGGFFHKLSNFIFSNNYIFFILSFICLIIIFTYKTDKFLFLSLIIPILISFSSGFWIFQKYFEPLIILLFFLLFDKKLIENILKKRLIVPLLYFSTYWIIYYAYSEKLISLN